MARSFTPPSEQALRTIFEHAAISMALVDADGHCLLSNPALRAWLGYSAGELEAMSLREFTYPEDADMDWRLFQELLAGQRAAYTLEERYLTRSGEVVWGRITVSLAGDAYAVALLEDITDGKRAQEEQRRTLFLLGERVKELTALHRAASLLQTPGLATDQLLQRLVDLLPPAWQYPEVTEARATFNGVTACTPGFAVTPWLLRVSFDTGEAGQGDIEVVYREQRPLEVEGPFLREEVLLMQSLAEMLSAYFEGQHHANMQRHYALALAKAHEVERREIARELHDSVTQALYGIALGSQTALSALRQDHDVDAAEAALGYVHMLVEAATDELRALIFELRPDTLEHEGLVAALERQAAFVAAGESVGVEVGLCGEPGLVFEAKEALYRIAQEAMHNVVRHANARLLRLTLSETNGEVVLEVADDGEGFDSQRLYSGHLGMISMRERAAAVGATFSIDSTIGGGTRVRVVIPVLTA
jgi:PAS domain S-box-containing protein